jgi:hypothetical protein
MDEKGEGKEGIGNDVPDAQNDVNKYTKTALSIPYAVVLNDRSIRKLEYIPVTSPCRRNRHRYVP